MNNILVFLGVLVGVPLLLAILVCIADRLWPLSWGNDDESYAPSGNSSEDATMMGAIALGLGSLPVAFWIGDTIGAVVGALMLLATIFLIDS